MKKDNKNLVLAIICFVIGFLNLINYILMYGFYISFSALVPIAFYIVLGIGILKNKRKMITWFLLGYFIYLFIFQFLIGSNISGLIYNLISVIRFLFLFLTSYFNLKEDGKKTKTMFILFIVFTSLILFLNLFNLGGFYLNFFYYIDYYGGIFFDILSILSIIFQIFICNWLKGNTKIIKEEKGYGYISIFGHVLFLIFTFGIWNLIWIYNTTTYINKNNKESLSKLLLCMFIPFYFIYWVNQYSNKIDNEAEKRNIYSNISGIATVLSIFTGIGAQIVMQCKINELTQSKNNIKIKEEKNNEVKLGIADEIKKYKELYDMDAITKEEYEEKKKQLLKM